MSFKEWKCPRYVKLNGFSFGTTEDVLVVIFRIFEITLFRFVVVRFDLMRDVNAIIYLH